MTEVTLPINHYNTKSKLLSKLTTTPMILLLVFSIALWFRLENIIIYGGYEEYTQWSLKYYFGGITPAYFTFAKQLLKDFSYTSVAYPPGYPAFLAALKWLHISNQQHVRIIQCLIDSLAIFPLFYIFRSLSVTRILSLLGCMIYAFLPVLTAGCTFLLAEWISPAAIISILFFMLLSKNSSNQYVYLALTGFMISVSAMFRPDLVLLIFMALIWIVLNKNSYKNLLKAIVTLLVGFSIIIGAWGVHNKITHNAWIFTSTGGGSGLWQGLGDRPNNKYGYILSDMKMAKEMKKHNLTWLSVGANKFLVKKYIHAFKQHPGYVFNTVLYRWGKIIALHPQIAKGKVTRSLIYFVFRHYGIYLFLLCIALYRKKLDAVFIISLPLVYALFSIGLVHYEPRYVIYVALSYIFATVLLLQFTMPYYQKWPLNRMSKNLIIGVLAICCASYFSYRVKIVKEASSKSFLMSESINKLKSASFRKHNLVKQLHLDQINLKQFSDGNSISHINSGILIQTNSMSGVYQYSYKINTAGMVGLVVGYDIKVRKGIATLGVLNQRLRQWLDAINVINTKSGELIVPTPGQKYVTLMIANGNPAPSQSIFELKKLDITFYKDNHPAGVK